METLALIAIIPTMLAAASLRWAEHRQARGLIAGGLWVHLALVAWLLRPLASGAVGEIRISEDLAINHLGAVFLLLTTLVAACSLTHAKFFFDREEQHAGKPTRWQLRIVYCAAVLFLLAMTGVFFCDNLGFLWIAIEATTLCSAPLVYFERSKHALEATWKYLIICSVGIAFALLGTVFIFASSQHGSHAGTLSVSQLIREAGSLQYPLLRLGFIFCFLGYGTKAGMFPLHSWLPDAHSEAPAPASAMLSGSLLNCALYGIWQVSQVVVAAHHPGVGHNLVVWAGTITVAAASLFLVRQHGFKRLWAYSSIENVGLMLVAIGIGSGALFFLQALNHSLAKVSLFLLSGNVVQSAGTKSLSDLRGIARAAPMWGLLLALSAFAVTGAPPFGSFISEWLILTRSTELNEWLVAVILLAALALSFVAVCVHLGRVLVGKPREGVEVFRPIATSVVPLILVGCSLVLGFATGPDLLGLAP
ncbi:MAG TPA: proton-conducting transporter membrane subunit [Candidatus Obscuribacterales bacterium]